MPITEGGRFTPNDRIVSPGVFTRENDLSGITQGIAEIGAAIVAPFPKGPGFSPMLINSSYELEEKFGTPDGVYYGPYAAKEYLAQKGFVTVCRVGALTGYHQRKPLVIYAQSGEWNRSLSIGTADTASTYLRPSASAINDYDSITFVGGKLVFKNPTIQWKFNASAADSGYGADPLTDTSGSKYFSGTSLTFNPAGLTASAYFTSSGGISESISNGKLSGSFGVITLNGTEPFSPVYLMSASFVTISDGCVTPVIKLRGTLSGSFGTYDGTFATSGGYIDNCGYYVTGSASRKVLAILADTLWAGVDKNLESPGFASTIKDLTVNRSLVGSITGITSSATYQSGSGTFNHKYLLSLSSSAGKAYSNYLFSLDTSDSNYITNVFGDSARVGDQSKYSAGSRKEVAYLYTVFEDSIKEVAKNPSAWAIVAESIPTVAASGSLAVSSSVSSNEPLEFVDQYSLSPDEGDSVFGLSNAYSPWVVSQEVATADGSNSRFDLFKVHSLSDGTPCNTSYKIEISDVKLGGTIPGTDWGTFTLSVRAYDDTENRPRYIESFKNLTLDPSSTDYIARRIGDRYNFITYGGKMLEFGTYANASRHIRIEMTEASYPITAVPYGFKPYYSPIGGEAAKAISPMVYCKASLFSLQPGKFASGVVFGKTLTSDTNLIKLYPTSSVGELVWKDNLQYFNPIPKNAITGAGIIFALDKDDTSCGIPSGSVVPAINPNDDNESTYVKMRRFVFGLQGGFDGQSPALKLSTGGDITSDNTLGLNCTNLESAGSIAYKQCIDALGNADEFDINLIVIPGIFHSKHSYVAELAIDMCESRGDCFYIMDNVVFPNPKQNQQNSFIDEAIEDVKNIDSNYVATYYPWVRIADTNLNKVVNVPPSVVMPSVYATSDSAAAEWFAPAGLTRGGIPQAVQTLDRVTFKERDSLYENRINPIAAFPGQGICVWGQKTLQIKQSSLDRVNVRRLLIALKKFIASTSKFLVFEQNTADTRNRFLSVVNPYLESVQQRNGLYAYQVKCDADNNTTDLIDSNILYGQIFLQPAKTAEFIVLDFNILPTGATFPGA